MFSLPFCVFPLRNVIGYANVRSQQLNEHHQRARFAKDNRPILNSRQGI